MAGDTPDFKFTEKDPLTNNLNEHAYSLPLEDWRGPAVAGGLGLAGGATLTGLGEIGVMKVAEPVFRPMMALGFAFLGGGRLASDIMHAPASTAAEIVSACGPKPLVIGGLIGAGLGLGVYEGYEWLKNKV